MSYRSTEVYRYLIFLQKYLSADLVLFHKLSQEAEKEEKRCRGKSNTGLWKLFKLFSCNIDTTVSMIETTKYPYSFEFMFGNPIIARSTIPNTQTLFSIIDILGYLNRNEPDFSATRKNIIEFFNHQTTLDPLELRLLTKVYRHGITHTYFPKLNMELSYHSSNPQGKFFFISSNGNLVLNVNALIPVVKNRIQSIIDDSSLYSNMQNQYSVMVNNYESDCRSDIEELKNKLKNHNTI